MGEPQEPLQQQPQILGINPIQQARVLQQQVVPSHNHKYYFGPIDVPGGRTGLADVDTLDL